MNHEIEQRILSLLRADYYDDEVASIIAVEYPDLNEFDLEDLPLHVRRIQQQREC